jgi:ANTAR domain-containing protein
MNQSCNGDRTLPKSLQALAQIAVRYAGAEGFAIYQLNPKEAVQELRCSWGVQVPGHDAAGWATDSYELSVDESIQGLLVFVFRRGANSKNVRPVLERIAGAIESVWRLSFIPDEYARKAAHVGQLEAGLADAKIEDRARGMLSDAALPEAGIDAILRHVESVLRPGQLATVLIQTVTDVENQVAERALANRAKNVLQRRYGMSEEQAHVHLRMTSRKSRKRLSEVALDVLRDARL